MPEFRDLQKLVKSLEEKTSLLEGKSCEAEDSI